MAYRIIKRPQWGYKCRERDRERNQVYCLFTNLGRERNLRGRVDNGFEGSSLPKRREGKGERHNEEQK